MSVHERTHSSHAPALAGARRRLLILGRLLLVLLVALPVAVGLFGGESGRLRGTRLTLRVALLGRPLLLVQLLTVLRSLILLRITLLRSTRLTLRVTLPARLLAVLRCLILLRVTLLRGAGLSLLGLLPEVLRLVLHLSLIHI